MLFASTPSYTADAGGASTTEGDDGEDDRAEHEAIDGEDRVVVTRDVAQQDRDRQPSADRRGEHAGDERSAEAAGGDRLRDLVEGGRRGDRHAHEEAEHRRALPVE